MRKLFFTAAVISTLFCACEKVETQSVTEGPASAELSFSSVATMDVLTRAGETTPYTDSFMINLSDDTNFYGGAISGMKVTNTSGAWTLATPVYLQKIARNLTAWAPENLSSETGTPNVFALSSALYEVNSDLVYAKTISVDSDHATIEKLTLAHAYSRITFKLAKDNYQGAGKLNTLTVSGIVPTAKMNIATGEISDAATAASLEMVTGGTELFADKAALVVPANGVTLKAACTLDNQNYEVDLPMKTLAAGTNYVVTMTVKGTQMGVTAVETEDWNQSQENVELK